jgi:SHS2 domain-containing protein
MRSIANFKFREDLALADLAFEAWGNTSSELFKNAALALLSSQADLNKIRPAKSFEVEKAAATVEELLFSFLEEIIYLKDTESLIFGEVEAKVREDDGGWTLKAVLKGEPVSLDRHELYLDAKAVTKHLFAVEKRKDGWRCRVIVDI